MITEGLNRETLTPRPVEFREQNSSPDAKGRYGQLEALMPSNLSAVNPVVVSKHQQ